MPRVSHFEHVYDDPEAAAKFYGEVFGWKTEVWEGGAQPYWMVTTGPDSETGINGGFMKPADERTPKVMNTVTVDDIDTVIAKAKGAGGELHMEKMTIPGVGYQAYIMDPGGVMFGIHQADPNAK